MNNVVDTTVNAQILGNSDLCRFAENIWIVDGPVVRDMGILFTTRMTVIKLSDGSLWLNSPVPVAYEILKRIVELGPVKYLIAGTPRHVWRLDAWHTLFPEAQLWTTQPTILTLQKSRLPFTGILGDSPVINWANDLDQLVFKGNPLGSEVLFFHRKTHTLILDDLIQIHYIKKGRPFENALLKVDGVIAPQGGVGLDIKLSFINRKLARHSLIKLLSWDFDKVIIAHGPCIEKDGKGFVMHAFRWLVK